MVVQSFGAENYQYRTAAEKLVVQLAGNRTESGPVDQTQLAAHSGTSRRGRSARRSESRSKLIPREGAKGDSARSARCLYERIGGESGMLLTKDFLQVWDAATATQRGELALEFMRKMNSYLRAHGADAPEEKRSNRVFQRLPAMFVCGTATR